MRNNIVLFSTLSLILIVSSCFREDDPITPHDKGGTISAGVKLGENYAHQVYFDLFDEEEKASNHIEDWDLAFDSQKGKWDIYLNSARLMYAGNTGSKDFSSVNTSNGVDMYIDASNGDSTAIGQWYNLTPDSIYSEDWVYIIDMGQNANYQPIGKVKLQVKALQNGYKVRVAKLDGASDQSYTLTKSTQHERIHLSIANGQVQIEPERDNFALYLTRYTTLLHAGGGTTQDYLVTGVLLNPNACKAAIDTVSNFNDVVLEDSSNYIFSSDRDIIGYDWKYYDFDNGVYSILNDRFYILKDYQGFYYKLRFVGFYDNNGLKGSPQFEFVRL